MSDETSVLEHLYGPLSKDIRQALGADRLVESGLPKKVLTRLATLMVGRARRDEVIYRVVPEGVYRDHRKLTTEASARTERLARVFAAAVRTFGSIEGASRFMFDPHPGFEGLRPFDVSLNEHGARWVEEELLRADLGLGV